MDRKVKRDLDKLMFDLNGQALIAVEYIKGIETYKSEYPNLSSEEYIETCCIIIENELQSLFKRV